jgi:hypothetical protein
LIEAGYKALWARWLSDEVFIHHILVHRKDLKLDPKLLNNALLTRREKGVERRVI